MIKSLKHESTQTKDDAPNPVDVFVGQQLRAHRSLKGFTQEDLATQTGITFQQIQKYEAGKNRISASRLYQFAQILSTPISSFFENFGVNQDNTPIAYGLSDNNQDGFDDSDIAPNTDQNIMTSKESVEVLRTYYAIKDETLRKDFLKMMKQMAKNFQS
jgi:transcriptional regulator with XRE-family HTH domain